MTYFWQQAAWPQFDYTPGNDLEEMLLAIAKATGYVTGTMEALPEPIRVEMLIHTLVAEAIKTSAIEGEYLSRPDVMSSIKNKLGLPASPLPVKDKKAIGIGALMVEVYDGFANPLTEEMLLFWHRILFYQAKHITVGAWRSHEETMQIVSGAVGKEEVHFEAPPSARVPGEMASFIQWFNDTGPGGSKEMKKAAVRAAVAHLYFETIHPFEDGNGRIGRAIAEKALSQTSGRPLLLSLSQTIESDKKSYYEALKTAQRNRNITQWVAYFLGVVHEAQIASKQLIDFTLKKTSFLDRYRQQANDRQWKVLLRMLESPDGFEGGMTAKKYMSLTNTSKATATRDLQMLVEINALLPQGDGRSTHYQLNIDQQI
jgi:Fic family protein